MTTKPKMLQLGSLYGELYREFALPQEAVTSTFGILGIRGSGKSNLARLVAEQMFSARLPFVAIDPVGSWYGLRSDRVGRNPGLPIPIFGGEHGDVPLDRNSGELLADLVVGKRLSCVADLSDFESEQAKKEFLLAFTTRLYRKNRDPLHLFLEESDDYIPQRVIGGSDKNVQLQLLRAMENIVRRGRARGLGITLITQRSACLNKNVLTQCETLFAMRTTSPSDQAPIKEWVKYHGQSKELVESLSSLPSGVAWCWSPSWLGRLEKVNVRRSSTFDSGATPKVDGERRAATLADIDIPTLSEEWTATIERHEEDDPKRLRAEIAKLKAELAKKQAPAASAACHVAHQHPFLMQQTANVAYALENAVKIYTTLGEALGEVSKHGGTAHRLAAEAHKVSPQAAVTSRTEVLLQVPKTPAPHSNGKTKGPAVDEDSESQLGLCERRILGALATHGSMSLKRLALVAGYASTGGGYNNSLGILRSRSDPTRAMITTGDPAALTKLGQETSKALGLVGLLPTGKKLAEWWMSESGRLDLAGRKILKALVDAGRDMTIAEVAKATGYEPSGGGFNNSFGRLCALGLVVKAGVGVRRAAEVLLS